MMISGCECLPNGSFKSQVWAYVPSKIVKYNDYFSVVVFGATRKKSAIFFRHHRDKHNPNLSTCGDWSLLFVWLSLSGCVKASSLHCVSGLSAMPFDTPSQAKKSQKKARFSKSLMVNHLQATACLTYFEWRPTYFQIRENFKAFCQYY